MRKKRFLVAAMPMLRQRELSVLIDSRRCVKMSMQSLEISPRVRSRERERTTLGSRSNGWMIHHALVNACTSSANFANLGSVEVLLSQKFSSEPATSKSNAINEVIPCTAISPGRACGGKGRRDVLAVAELRFCP